MYVWNESIASRGGQEIGLCLLKHITNHVSSDVSEIIAYPDRCGGQNKNIKLTMLLKKYLHDLIPDHALNSITQKYFVSGHSYNSCDRSFALIEKERKKSGEVYTPSEWFDLIKRTRKSEPKFEVTMMSGNDFVSSVELQTMIVNQKTSLDGVKLNWHDIKQMKYKKDVPFEINALCNTGEAINISIKKKNFDAESLAMCNMPLLYPNGKPISQKKYEDLIKLLKYVPPEHHSFFTTLKKDDHKEDFFLFHFN